MTPKNFLLISYRYLTSNKKEKTIDSMITICFAGICIATCALALVISIMKGFEQSTHQTIKSIYPDLIIDANNHEIDMALITPILKEKEFCIAAISPQLTAQALLYHKDFDDNPTVICLKGIDPDSESLVTDLEKKIIEPKESHLSNLLIDNHICIGHKLAKYFHLKPQDNIQLLYTNDEPEHLKVTFQKAPVIISGIFKTGIDEFDTSFVYCNQNFFKKLFPDQGIHQIYVKLEKNDQEQETMQKLSKRLHVDIYSWKNLFPALIAALKLETYAMSFILLLIVIIASMNNISLLFMYVTQKKKEIALLLCLGLSIKKIRLIFINITILISITATALGLLIAWMIGLVIQHYPIIKLPDDAYFTNYLPISLDTMVFYVIFISSISICIGASIYSTKNLHSIQIVKTLKE